jgi:predicted metal-dependent peptidase
MSNISAAVIEKITIARVGLLLRQPFFGHLATRLKIVESSKWCDTAATDGVHFFYNESFINTLQPKQIEFVFAHEVLHCVFDHIGRLGSRSHILFNIACDYVINNILIRDRIGESVPEIYADPTYLNKSAEEVYALLVPQGEINVVGKGRLLDMHIGAEQYDTDAPFIPQSTMAAYQEQFREAMLAAAQGSNANLPLEIANLVANITSAKIDWQSIIRSSLQSASASNTSFSYYNKKSQQAGVILPGNSMDTHIDVAIAIDTSGSISKAMVQDFINEVAGMVEQYTYATIKIWCFDTAIHNYAEYTNNDFIEYSIAGGGGTVFEVNWRFMENNHIHPDTLIVFTDGLPQRTWGDEHYCETVFVIHSNPNITAPFGTSVHYDAA